MLSPEQTALRICIQSSHPPPSEEHQRRHRAASQRVARARRHERWLRIRRGLAATLRSLADRLAPNDGDRVARGGRARGPASAGLDL